MLSFDYRNVMSLIAVCFDGVVLVIFMPYMSNGSVLRHVKQNQKKLLPNREVNKVEVCKPLIFAAKLMWSNTFL